jgi:hypothetical protein
MMCLVESLNPTLCIGLDLLQEPFLVWEEERNRKVRLTMFVKGTAASVVLYPLDVLKSKVSSVWFCFCVFDFFVKKGHAVQVFSLCSKSSSAKVCLVCSSKRVVGAGFANGCCQFCFKKKEKGGLGASTKGVAVSVFGSGLEMVVVSLLCVFSQEKKQKKLFTMGSCLWDIILCDLGGILKITNGCQ